MPGILIISSNMFVSLCYRYSVGTDQASQHESDCSFTFDFTAVYWNSRLHTEHERMVHLFQPGDVVVDVMAGVGPFAIPAAKRGCAVLANDLNPCSYEYLCRNIVANRASVFVLYFVSIQP